MERAGSSSCARRSEPPRQRVNDHTSGGLVMHGFARICRSLGVVGTIALAIVSTQLVACGGGNGVEGEYVMQMGEDAGEGMTLELKSDGKAILTMAGMPPVQGPHMMEADKLVVILNNDRDVYTIGPDGNLTTTEMGEPMVWVKQ